MNKPVRKLLVEGWLSICHSYSIVNQWQLLSLRKKKNLETYFRESPAYDTKWATLQGLFNADDSAYLASLQDSDPADCDAVYRIDCPYNFKNIHAKTAVFITSEYKTLLQHQYNTFADFQACINQPHVKIVTPTTWSADGFYRQGCDADQVIVVPHGVDTTVFRKSDEKRLELRKKLHLSGFVFMNIGAMTENKGIGLLLKAFSVVASKRPYVRLLLKGTDGLYPSTELLQKCLSELSVTDQHIVISKCSYIGDSMSMADMADMYQAADAYVSPYMAEGFNMPVLEALACGVPVICTKGGATDDFVLDNFALKINSQLTPVRVNDCAGEMLVPNLDHLIHLMFKIMDDTEWRNTASALSVAHVNRNYTWDIVTDKLIDKLLYD
ncbi:MAG: glycosyltransferase family 4 protein [Nitrospirae bacterium]|nr:glycosyltransferase family 4 protein [Nitrospirota bacterium]